MDNQIVEKTVDNQIVEKKDESIVINKQEFSQQNVNETADNKED